jgi:hypothetical protein
MPLWLNTMGLWMAKKKHPKAKPIPTVGKDPRIAHQNKPDDQEKRMVWRFSIIDADGPFGWGVVPRGLTWEIINKVRDLETCTIQELKNSGSHNIRVSDLSKPAQNRLTDIKQDDIDEIFSLRISGKERIFGILDRNVLKVLWWDPDHQVCPSPKKHT